MVYVVTVGRVTVSKIDILPESFSNEWQTRCSIMDAEPGFLDTVEGEIWFFKAITLARPVGLHRHFHVLAMRSTILKATGKIVSIDDIWAKLRTCYNLDSLEAIVSISGTSRSQLH